MKVVALVPDLMDRSKVRAAFPEAALVARAEQLVEAASGADLVLVDLQRPGVLETLTAWKTEGGNTRVVGFASHVEGEVLAAAEHAGVEALPRSVFFRRLPGLRSGGE
jgi:CheY-like chemotaxis protein